MRVIRCKEAEANRKPEDCIFPVFAVVGTKLKKMANLPQVTLTLTFLLHFLIFVPPVLLQIFEMSMSNTDRINRLPTGSDLVDSVRGMQQFSAARARTFRETKTRLLDSADARQEEVALELRSTELPEPKYSLYVAEGTGHKKSKMRFAVFIVPQGRWVRGEDGME